MDAIEVPVAVEMEETLITRYDNQDGGAGRGQGQKDFQYNRECEGKKIHFEGAEDNGMEMTLITVTETTGTRNSDSQGNSNRGRRWDNNNRGQRHSDCTGEGEDGIPINNITIQGINNNPNFQTQIIIIHHLWDINTDTQSHMSNTHIPNNNNINPKCRQLHLNKLQIFVSYVTVKAITIINANLQVILWPAHKRPSIKADHTATKTRIMGTGHMATMITMTLMGNLFSNGGSRCR